MSSVRSFAFLWRFESLAAGAPDKRRGEDTLRVAFIGPAEPTAS